MHKIIMTFTDLLYTSTIIQAIIALASVGVILYLYVIGHQVPEELIGIVMLILGYYFGSKTQQNINLRNNQDATRSKR